MGTDGSCRPGDRRPSAEVLRATSLADVYSDRDLLRWSEALAGIARTGLGFTESLYERERFEEVLAVAAEIRAMVGTPGTPDTIVDEWMKHVGEGVAGYQTPKA